jgi:putative transposase
MGIYRLSQEAESDLIRIHQYGVIKHGEAQADRRFWEHTLSSQADYNQHFDYLHYNPIKHGIVKHLSD